MSKSLRWSSLGAAAPIAILCLGVGALSLAGCERKSEAEKAVDKATDTVKDAAQKTEEAAKDAVDAVKDAVK
ncbi:MAG TPA: hypothetical protein PKC43_11570 [Phycisphaerales bacterium]|nr:hypothetical protein [Phycisphaerales bacterium]HMP38071.1 hypothetical protein [Phycisphaerales bacterium]